jgi:hypothetical protein
VSTKEIPGDRVLRLSSLDIENVLRIRAVHLTMDENGALVIEAKNEQGKTSVLRSIEMLLAGGKAIAEDPIHGNAKSGSIVATFGDIRVEKIFKRGKSPALKITSPEGTHKRPQSILAAFIDAIALDPLKFRDYDDARKAKTIADLMGFDSSELDAKRAAAYEARTEANREEKRLRSVVMSLPEIPGMGYDKEVSVAELVKELDAAQTHNAKGDELSRELHRYGSAIGDMTKRLTELRAELDTLEVNLAAAKAEQRKAISEVASFKPINDAEIREKIDNAEKINESVRAKRERESRTQEWEAAAAAASQADKDLEAIDAELDRARSEAAAKLPVEGLSLSDGVVLYNGKPLSQAGASAELRVSAAISIAANKDRPLKLLCIDDGEKLDLENTRMIFRMAREAGYQVMMAGVEGKVGDGETPSVLIEDGVIADAK